MMQKTLAVGVAAGIWALSILVADHAIAGVQHLAPAERHADAQSYATAYDDAGRVRRIEYKDSLVVTLVGHADHPVMIELNPDEPIEDTAGGPISNWEIVKRQSRLYVRPLADARPATIVIASRTRSYVLDLLPGKVGATPTNFVSKVIVTYPIPAATIAEQAEAKAVEAIRDSTPLKEAMRAPIRNEHYSLEVLSETIDIKPRRVFDDGRFTYMQFPENLPIPAIYKSTAGSREEWLVNNHRDGDYVVLHGVGSSWNLRLSGSVLGVFNDAYDATGFAPVNDTTIQGLQRVAK